MQFAVYEQIPTNKINGNVRQYVPNPNKKRTYTLQYIPNHPENKSKKKETPKHGKK